MKQEQSLFKTPDKMFDTCNTRIMSFNARESKGKKIAMSP